MREAFVPGAVTAANAPNIAPNFVYLTLCTADQQRSSSTQICCYVGSADEASFELFQRFSVMFDPAERRLA